ncbi:MAG: hypothetical protein Kow00109_19450 [Acidobacteriota bacterium]
MAFCRYYLAELAAEAGKLGDAEDHASAALTGLDRASHPYLAAVLEESRSFALWYQGRLEEATQGFARALADWRRSGYLEGQVAGWNNLAAVFEELGLQQRAESCYVEALACVRNDTSPEVRGRLFLNYASFTNRRGERERALRFLEAARPVRDLLGDEYLLTQLEVTGETFSEDRFFQEASPESRIRYLLIRAEWALRARRWSRAENLVREAERIAEQENLRFFQRPIALALGRAQEAEGHLQEALARYDRLLAPRLATYPFLTSAFPFEKAATDLLSAKLRVLALLGREAAARRELVRWHHLRRRTLQPLLRRLAPPENPAGEPGAEIPGAGEAPPAIVPVLPAPVPDFPLPVGIAAVQLWPDSRESVLAWVREGTRSRFLRLPVSSETDRNIVRLQQTWAAAEGVSLPPPYLPDDFRRLARELLSPLLENLTSRRVVLTPHGWLETVPFEILPLAGGDHFGLQYAVTYAPAGAEPVTRSPSTQPPVALLSDELFGRPGHTAERRFFHRVPGVRVYGDLPLAAAPREVPWVYLGTHLRPDPRLWFLAHLGFGPKAESLAHLVHPPWRTRLMVLAGCHGVQAGWESTPFWMGLSELVLAAGVEAFVANRWALAERSVPLFLDTLAGALAGLPTDVALLEARRRFVRTATRRAGASPHPFLWGGVIFVGPPDHRLTEAPSPLHSRRDGKWWPPAMLLLGAVGHLGYTRLRYRVPENSLRNHRKLL